MKRWQTTEGQQGTRRVSDFWLRELSAFVTERMGLCFPRWRWSDFERGLRNAAREFGFEDLESCAQWVVSSPLSREQTEILASHLTIGETYLFRDKSGFDALGQRILPELIQSRRGRDQRLKIWSAGCATGEEAYSIAIQVSRAIPDYKEWNITISATDINTRFLRKASEGVFSEWSFRNTPSWLKEGYFRGKGKQKFEVFPHIRKMVDFEYLNLAEDVYPSFLNNLYAVDVIFCRNVLMYFVSEQAERVLSGFYRSLVDGGWLIVDPSDLLHVKDSEFASGDSKNPNLFRKDLTGVLCRREPERGDAAPPLEPLKYPETPHRQPEIHIPKSEIPIPHSALRIPHSEVPPEDDTLYADALDLYRGGHYENAAAKLLESLSGSPPRAGEPESPGKEMTLLAQAHANLGDLAEALAWCDKAIAANKLQPVNYYLRASILQEQERTEDAAVALRQTLFLDPDFVLGHFTLGNLARSQGKTEESEKHFANALRLLGRHPEDSILPESGGVTAGRLAEIITSMTGKEF